MLVALSITKTYLTNGRYAGQMREYEPAITTEQAAVQLNSVGYNVTAVYLNRILGSNVEHRPFPLQQGNTHINVCVTTTKPKP